MEKLTQRIDFSSELHNYVNVVVMSKPRSCFQTVDKLLSSNVLTLNCFGDSDIAQNGLLERE